jgi:hypothetical protein
MRWPVQCEVALEPSDTSDAPIDLVFGARVTVKRGDCVSFAAASQRFEMLLSASTAVTLPRALMIFRGIRAEDLAGAIAGREKRAS